MKFKPVLLLLLLLAGSFYSTDNYKAIAQAIFSLGLVVMFAQVFLSAVKKPIIQTNSLQFSLFLLTFISMLMAALYHRETDLIVGSILFIVTFWYLSNVNKYGEQLTIPGIRTAFYLTFTVVTLISISSGVSFPYRGMFYNPNSLGSFYSLMTFFACGVILDHLLIKPISKPLYLGTIAMLFISIAFALLSYSRIAFASSLLAVFGILLFLLISSMSLKRLTVNKTYLLYLVSALMLAFILIVANINAIQDIFIYKLETKLSAGDLTDDRASIWAAVWETRSIFGHGRDLGTVIRYELAPHSTYFSVLGASGLISFFLFISACIVSLLTCLKRSTIESYGYLPLFITVNFLTASITEGMLMKMTMFAFFCFLNLVPKINRADTP